MGWWTSLFAALLIVSKASQSTLLPALKNVRSPTDSNLKSANRMVGSSSVGSSSHAKEATPLTAATKSIQPSSPVVKSTSQLAMEAPLLECSTNLTQAVQQAALKPVEAEVLKKVLLQFALRMNPKLDAALGEQIVEALVAMSDGLKVDPRLIAALIARESSFRPDAVSRSGATGIGQLMPATAKELGVLDPLDPIQNLRGTVVYLSRQQEKFKSFPDSIERALAAYRLGPMVVELRGGIPNVADVAEYLKGIQEHYQHLVAATTLAK